VLTNFNASVLDDQNDEEYYFDGDSLDYFTPLTVVDLPKWLQSYAGDSNFLSTNAVFLGTSGQLILHVT
jgi:hypothetical protein